MPEEGVPNIPHDEVLRLEDIANVVRTAVGLGFDKIRLTGGEPLVRKGIVDLVAMLSEIKGIRDLAMTTNGVLLSRYARELKKAGLMRVNVSLDSMDRDTFLTIARRDRLQDVLEGIRAADEAGLTPIKINTVLLRDGDRREAEGVTAFAHKHGYEIRYIHQMNLQTGEFWPVEGGEGGNCGRCNRLRLSSRGIIYPCLFSDAGYDIHDYGIEDAIRAAVQNKPGHGVISSKNTFYGLGG